jgi:hypothetical protein
MRGRRERGIGGYIRGSAKAMLREHFLGCAESGLHCIFSMAWHYIALGYIECPGGGEASGIWAGMAVHNDGDEGERG